MYYLIYILLSFGAGIITGLTDLSTAIIITPILISICNWSGYDAVTVALAADILLNLLLTYTYYKNKTDCHVTVIHLDMNRGLFVMITAFIGTIIGSYSSYILYQNNPDSLEYISLIMMIVLGIKLLVKPIFETQNLVLKTNDKIKTLLVISLGSLSGWICGFIGSGSSILLLMIFTVILGYNLRLALGASTLIMAVITFYGTINRLLIGSKPNLLPMFIIITFSLLGILFSKKIIEKCNMKRFNRNIGLVLTLLGIVVIGLNES